MQKAQKIRRADKIKLKEAAHFYRRYLNNKNILYICTDQNLRYQPFEIKFGSSNFKHLTGIKTDQKPYFFMRDCLTDNLTETNYIYTNHTINKIDHLLQALVTLEAPPYIATFNERPGHPLKTDILIGDERKCIGAVKDGNCFYPNTILVSDTRKFNHLMSVDAIFKKNIREKQYTKMIVLNSRFNINELDDKTIAQIDIQNLKIMNPSTDYHLVDEYIRLPQHVLDHLQDMARINRIAITLNKLDPSLEDVNLLLEKCHNIQRMDNADDLSADDYLDAILQAIIDEKTTLTNVLCASDFQIIECIYNDNYESLANEYDMLAYY